MMKKTLLLLLFILIAGCVRHLRPDSSPPAVESEYPTIEFHLKDKIYHGLGVIPVTEGTDLATLGLSVQTYYSGSIRIDSKDCGIAFSKVYSNFEKVVIPLTGLANRSCVVSVVMSPKYAPQNSDPITVYGFKGHFVLRMIKTGESWTGGTHKVTGKFSVPVTLNVGGTGIVRAVFSGCGVDFDQDLPLDDGGFLHLDLNQVVALKNKSTCVLEGVIISPVYQDLLINEVVSQYDPGFSPLPEPSISGQNSTLTVNGSGSVSVVGLDLSHRFASSANFKNFNPNVPHIVRVFTVKGRSTVCKWDTREWLCQQ